MGAPLSHSLSAISVPQKPGLDLSRFRSGFLRAILAIKQTGSGSDTQRRVQNAVRIAQTSGLTRCQVASDLGIECPTLNRWVKAVSDEAGSPDPDQNPLRENERLRRENRILKDLSRTGKQSGRLFSRRMWELPKNRHGPQPACAR